MLIIFEGPDGSGKTTLATKVAERLGCDVVHRGPPQHRYPYYEYIEPLNRSKTQPMVCDRWHLGELVYGPLLRGSSMLSSVDRMYIDTIIRELGGIMVYCRPDSDVVVRNVETRGDSLITPDRLPRIIAKYEQLMRSSLVGGLTVDPFTELNLDHKIIEAARCIDSFRRLQASCQK